MRRRTFLAALGAAAAWPLAARPQTKDRLPRLGYLAVEALVPPAAVLEGLRDLGYVDGETMHIEFRSAEGKDQRLAALAAELVGLNVDVIVTTSVGVYVAARATRTIPIVMAAGGDIVAAGIAESLAHPGGNVTGQMFFAPELYAKRLELLKEVAPAMTRAGVMMRRANPSNAHILEVMTGAAKALNVTLQPIEVARADELESAVAAAADARVTGLVAADTQVLMYNAALLADAAARRNMTLIGFVELAARGGLIGYGVNFAALYRRAAVFVDKILKGAKPGDIPIEQATKFTTVINLKTAKALKVDIPLTLLARADEVIE